MTLNAKGQAPTKKGTERSHHVRFFICPAEKDNWNWINGIEEICSRDCLQCLAAARKMPPSRSLSASLRLQASNEFLLFPVFSRRFG